MEISLILIFIFVLIIDVILVSKDIKNKLLFSGGKKFKFIIPVMIIAFIILALKENDFKIENIIICIEILPLAFVGNKAGITEKGFLLNSYVTPWDKVENYSTEDSGDKYIINYITNLGSRKISFKQEQKDEVKKYLLGINKLRYKKK